MNIPKTAKIIFFQSFRSCNSTLVDSDEFGKPLVLLRNNLLSQSYLVDRNLQ